MINGKIITLPDGTYLFYECTAIAVSVGDTTRQKAVLIHHANSASGDAASLLFGYSVDDLPNSPTEVTRILASEPISFDDDDLKTILIDGKSVMDFVWDNI